MPDHDVVEGKVKQGIGSVQRKIGEMNNDPVEQQRGLDKQTEGKAQEGVGKVKDAVRDTVETIKRNI